MAHICRLDKGGSTGAGATHGWQVRWRPRELPANRYRSKMFSDNHYGGSAGALAAAKKFLREIKKTVELASAEPPAYRTQPGPHNTSGIVGVRWHWVKSRQGIGKTLYAEAHINIRPYPQAERPDDPAVPHYRRLPFRKRFRVGRYKRMEAWELAKEFRRMYEAAEEIGTVTAFNAFLKKYHYSRLINMKFGSAERERYEKTQEENS